MRKRRAVNYAELQAAGRRARAEAAARPLPRKERGEVPLW